MGIMADLHQRAGDVFQQMETDIIFDIKMVATDKLNRKCGLGTDLLRRSVQLAQSLGYKAIKTEATGLYSRKAFERLGFIVVAEFLYAEYEVDGELIFEKIKNHRGTVFMLKRLSEVTVTRAVEI
ncbi:dopamine N-acetyltransferase [Eurytemora carolleeae]|uniref:dopamine N-acetyltransferase n=1 Tax=Eurytemora carolleeae TaxID=1294199 RepID=UPI000C792242|nr:dopamine N-acetyltransferase [Eurytemora carolleeae]|eukprot:XP_023320089.1 dopamine N-acetyltransferase-like [Eurytemora affinis]